MRSILHDVLAHPLAERLGWTLAHSLWQFAAVAVVLAGVLMLLKRGAAQTRYVASCAALAACLAAAGVTFLLLDGKARVALIPSDAARAVVTINVETVDPAPTPARAPDLLAQAEALLPWLSVAWLAGVCGLSLRNAGAWLHVRALRSRAEPLTCAPWPDVFERLRQAMRVSRRVELARCDLVDAPGVVGWLKPLVLVPAAALTGLPPQHLEALLAHELAHVRRHDYLVNLVQTVVETLLFYHPAVWSISRVIRREREHCCDDLAADACGSRRTYAHALARMEALRLGGATLALGANGTSLLPRIRRLLGVPAPARRRVEAWPVTLVSVVCVAVVFGTARQRVNAEPPGTAPTTAPATAPADRSRPALLGPPDPKMVEQLRKTLPEINLQGTPFADVVDFLRDVTGVNIFVNWKALEAVGVDRAAAVSLRARDVTLDMALRLILRDLGGDAAKLAYVADQNVIIISTKEDLARSVVPPSRVGEYYMSGVERSGTYSLSERSITLKQAIIAAGINYTRDLEKHVVVIRRDPATGATSRTVHPLGSLVRNAVGDTHVELGDVIMVTDQPPAAATQPGAATAPAEAPPQYYISGVPRDGVYSIDGGRRVTLLQALIAAGVNPPDARGQVVTVRRRHVEAPILQLTVGELIEKGGAGDEPLQPGDQIILDGAPK